MEVSSAAVVLGVSRLAPGVGGGGKSAKILLTSGDSQVVEGLGEKYCGVDRPLGKNNGVDTRGACVGHTC